MSDLVRNYETRFSHEVVQLSVLQIMIMYCNFSDISWMIFDISLKNNFTFIPPRAGMHME